MGEARPPGRRAFDTKRHFELSADLMCVAGFDGYFKLVNPAWSLVLGYEPGELLGRPFLEFVHPEDRAATEAEAGRLAEGAQTLHFENRYRCRDGSYRWLAWTSVPDQDAGLLYAVARDITQSRADSERLRQVFQASLNGIVEADELGLVTNWNAAADRMFGWSAEEIIGQPLTGTIIPPRYREHHEEGMRRYLASGKGALLGQVVELSGLHRDGHEFPIELSISAGWRDESTTRFVAYVRDLTQRHHDEALERVRRKVSEILAESIHATQLAPRLLALLGAELGWQAGELWLVDGERRHLRRLAEWSADGLAWRRFVDAGGALAFTGGSLPGLVWEAGAVVELTEPSSALAPARRDAARAAGIQLAVGLPVLLGTGTGTVMTFFGTTAGPVPADALELMRDTCSRVGNILQRDQTDARMRAVLDNVADGIVTLDAAGLVESINLPGRKMVGKQEAELVGESIAVLVAKEGRRVFQEYLDRILEGPAGADGSGVQETRGVRTDGSTFPMDFLASEMALGGRRLLIASLRDVSERVRVQQEAQLSEDRLQAVLRSSPIMLATVDSAGAFDFAGGEIATEIGLDASTLVGHSYSERYRDNPVIREWWGRAVGGESHTQQVVAAGQTYLTYFVPLQRDGSPAGAAMVGMDITEQADAQRQAVTRSRHQAAIIHVGREALAGSDFGVLVQKALETVAGVLEVPLAVVFTINLDQETATVMAVVDDADTAVKPGVTFPLALLSSYQSVVAHGGPVAVDDLETAGVPRNEMMVSLGIRALLAALIPGAQRPIGTILLLSRNPRAWSPSELEFVQVIGSVVSVASQRMRAEDQRRRLLARLVNAQEEERQSIANDIHDDAVQVMTAANMRLDILRRQLGDAADSETMDRLQQTVSLSISRLRHLLFELSPPALERYGLAAALRMALDQVRSDTGIEVEVTGSLGVEPEPARRTLVYRVFQEALANIRKHAGASHITVALGEREGGTEVVIADDGAGFDLGDIEAPRPGHLGITAMVERMELAGGRVKITSRPGAGTTVRLWMPA